MKKIGLVVAGVLCAFAAFGEVAADETAKKPDSLKALVWTAKLFGADVTKCSYAPKGMSAGRAEFLRKIAMKALQK